MTKAEIRAELLGGTTLNNLLPFGPGQDCEIFKADHFSPGDEVIYVPDVTLNEIPLDRPITELEELDDVIGNCYTGDDFIDQCEGDRALAERLFWYCDWQHPSSAVNELIDED